jgi:hypothetical protein
MSSLTTGALLSGMLLGLIVVYGEECGDYRLLILDFADLVRANQVP